MSGTRVWGTLSGDALRKAKTPIDERQAEQLVGVPVIIGHDPNASVGVVTYASVEPGTGTFRILCRVDDTEAIKQLSSGALRGFTMSGWSGADSNNTMNVSDPKVALISEIPTNYQGGEDVVSDRKIRMG